MITSDTAFYRSYNLELNLAFMAAYTAYKFLWLSMIKPQIIVLDLYVFYTARLELCSERRGHHFHDVLKGNIIYN